MADYSLVCSPLGGCINIYPTDPIGRHVQFLILQIALLSITAGLRQLFIYLFIFEMDS